MALLLLVAGASSTDQWRSNGKSVIGVGVPIYEHNVIAKVKVLSEKRNQYRQVCVCCTVWKFHDFSITQILREINFGECKVQNLPL